MRAAKTPLERVRRLALHESLRAAGDAPCWYDVGALVWVRFGSTGGLQLARIRLPGPVAFEGGALWWWVSVFWPSRGRWIQTHRRVLRALTPTELVAVSTSGVVERNGA